MNITQAERDAMVKRFERCNECRLRPKTLEDGWMHSSDVIYNAELERLIEMIRGGSSAIQPICSCKGSPFGMDVERCPRHGTRA